MELVRKNIRMSGQIADWYADRAKELGVSQTNLMVMALGEYIKQEKTIDVMANLQVLINQMEIDKTKDYINSEEKDQK